MKFEWTETTDIFTKEVYWKAQLFDNNFICKSTLIVTQDEETGEYEFYISGDKHTFSTLDEAKCFAEAWLYHRMWSEYEEKVKELSKARSIALWCKKYLAPTEVVK